jgi:NADPH:quinone reductase-like Zn-dependent oxidoreductase
VIAKQLAALLEKGSLRAVVDREFPLADAVAAVSYLKEGHAAGKVMVRVAEDQQMAD